VLQSLTKGARLDEFTPVEAAAGLAYVLVAVVQDAVLPVAWALKHLPSSMHDDSHFTQAVALLPQAQQRLLVAVSGAATFSLRCMTLACSGEKAHSTLGPARPS
jgi:hypothetical protein